MPPIDVDPSPAPADAERREAIARLFRWSTLAMGGASAGLVSCGGGNDGAPAPAAVAGAPAPAPGPAPAPAPAPGPAPAPIVATTFTTGLQNPWGLAFLPDDRILVTLKNGELVIVSADGQSVGTPLGGVPAVSSAGQGGLLDVALDPDFGVDPWVYFSYAEPGSGAEAGLSGTAVARGRLAGNALQNVSVIFRQLPKLADDMQYGCRLAFGADKTLFATLGDRRTPGLVQDLTTHIGKVVRINRDGGVPAGNPSLGPTARREIWSWGHRNPQGAAIHPATGDLWVMEHGPQGGDEVNIAVGGNNHGWPLRSYGCNTGGPGNGCRVGGGVHAPAYDEPVTFWPNAIAPGGSTFYTGNLMPEWYGNLFIGALTGRALWRLSLEDNAVLTSEPLFASLDERIRKVGQGPDGALYLLTDSTAGRIIRVGR